MFRSVFTVVKYHASVSILESVWLEKCYYDLTHTKQSLSPHEMANTDAHEPDP